MGKHRNPTWGRADAQKRTFPSPSSHKGEAGDTSDAVQDLRDDVDLLEEGRSQMDTSPKMPFRFM